MPEKPSEIDCMVSPEPFILESIHLREVSFDKTGIRLYIKLQGTNSKSEQIEQLRIYLNKRDSEDLAKGINEAIKQGLL